MLSLKKLFGKMLKKAVRTRQARSAHKRLTLEVLEDRVVLDTYPWTGASGTNL